MLKNVFGFDTFRPGQEEVVDRLLEGESALAVFPTGGGKSLCYQLPALRLEGMTLVVSPLIALMKDQIDFLVGKGVRAARLDSSLSGEEARAVWDDLWNGRLKLLYVAPERFASERFIQRLRRSTISLMVVDEAHCISEWGHNFRPDYLKLAALADDLRAERVLALTATATPSVADDICRSFSIKPGAYINTGFHRPNLIMRTVPCQASARDGLLLDRLRSRPRGATIVYVTLQKTAERIAEFLSAGSITARAYHAGMEGDDRHAVQDWFMASPDAVVVATIAFGMGIDKPDIRYVYHYNMPKSLENYMQETGRAGRDGAEACCDLMVCPDDIATLENFSYGDTPALASVQGVIAHVCGLPEAFDLSVYELSAAHDMRGLVVSTLLTYLELEGVLASTGPLYNEYKFQPQRSSSEMLADFDEDRRRFLRAMFARARKARTWFSLDIAATAAALGERRERIVAALNHFEDRGDLILKVAGLRRGYRFVQRPADPGVVAQTLHARFEESETRDIARIGQVVALASMTECTVKHVLDYFGESLATDCGHCDRCLGEPIPPLPAHRDGALSEADMTAIQSLVQEQHTALGTSRQLTRFLCGLTSPAASRAGLGRDNRFGRFTHMRFHVVMKAVGSGP
ncbi:MAG: RecQ family ATP-dependent DNA helicase [Verrucomicrobia bacterium]|nr:RecQ family ATP-dependent DNA helicase [Verrucomicrobiota bacterium]MBT7069056.1 RecQ family ATP-dependent DNA helicase [Verrucomicrobiota bacterium]MBT7699538.1 RecQ family ATP-dependent DNA helicase [Verrucomicrobiota bacterium]